MKKVFDEEMGYKYYLGVSTYRNNNRLYIGVFDREDGFREEIDYSRDITINLSDKIIDSKNKVFLCGDLSDESKYKLIEKGIISKPIEQVQYNMGKYDLVEVNLDVLKEYDPEGVEEFLNLNKENDSIVFYNKQEIKKLLNDKTRLVYIDTGIEEVVAKYEDLPDIIVDINEKMGSTNLKVSDYPSAVPILTTIGYFLDKCDSNVRKDIIDRLVGLQLGEIEIKDYKVIDEDMLDDVRITMEQKEMDR